jgi:hypothetical protein
VVNDLSKDQFEEMCGSKPLSPEAERAAYVIGTAIALAGCVVILLGLVLGVVRLLS